MFDHRISTTDGKSIQNQKLNKKFTISQQNQNFDENQQPFKALN